MRPVADLRGAAQRMELPVEVARLRRPEASQAFLDVRRVAGQSAVTASCARSPLQLLIPRARGPSVWVYTSSLGGGMVAGDQTRLELRLDAGTRCLVSTQASTKIYRNPEAKPCGHTTEAHLGPEAFLAYLPDPVQAFAQATYAQTQLFYLAPDSGLVLVDWLSAGRTARGERWAFADFFSSNQIFVGGRRLLIDALSLNPAAGPLAAPHRLGRFNCLALAVALGKPVREAASKILQETAARSLPRRSSLIQSASPLPEGALLRLAGESVEEVGHELARQLAFVSELLHDDPWSRKW